MSVAHVPRSGPALVMALACAACPTYAAPGAPDDSDAVDCERFPATSCPRPGCAVATGLRLDTPSACVAERRAFCFDDASDLAVTVAVDGDGARWIFGSTTIPSGWTAFEAEEVEGSAYDGPECR